jgi:cytoskeletal protein CcmA (bactofilin family)
MSALTSVPSRNSASDAAGGSHRPALPAAPLALVEILALTLLGGVLLFVANPPGTAATASLDVSAAPPFAAPPLGCVSGNLVAFARALVVGADQSICGDVDTYGGSVTVLGRVGGNVTAFGGSVSILGEVDGNVTAFGGSVDLAPGARVAGDVRTWGGGFHRASGAFISGDVERGDRIASAYGAHWLGFSGGWSFPWPWILGWSVLAAVVITLFPERTARVRIVARRAAMRSLVVGLLTALLGIALAGVLFATCIGIPISLLVMAALLAGWVLGTVAVGLWLGERVVHAMAPRAQSPLLPAVVGVALLTGAELIPCVGGAVAVIASSLGLGAALLSRFGAQRSGLPMPLPSPPRL